MDLVTDVNVQRLDTALPLAGTMIYKNVQLFACRSIENKAVN